MALPHLPHLPSVTFFEYHKAVSGLASRLTVHGSLLRNLVFFALIGLVLVFLVTGADELFEKNHRCLQRYRGRNPCDFIVLFISPCYGGRRFLGRLERSRGYGDSEKSRTIGQGFNRPSSEGINTCDSGVYPFAAESLAEEPELRAFIMIVAGTQWYVFFQVLVSLKNVPQMELELVDLLQLKTWEKVKTVYLPRAMPAFITGCITAAGGAWNGLVVAERLVLGDNVAENQLPGLGKLLSKLTYAGKLVGSIAVMVTMSRIIGLMNRLFWKRLYDF